MKNQKVIINNIEEADLILKEFKENEVALSALNLEMDKAIDEAKFAHLIDIEPIEERQKELEKGLITFATEHKEEIGKSKKLKFGKLGFKSSTKLILKEAEESVLEKLKKINLMGCISLKETVSKAILKKQPEAIIEQVGAKLETEENFFFETSKN